MKPVEVRAGLADALGLDLVGPGDRVGSLVEVLPQRPALWYLTGFLVPLDAGRTQRSDETSNEELDQSGNSGGAGDDQAAPERAAARRRYLPSSIGVTVLVPPGVGELSLTVRWGDYVRRSERPEEWARSQKRREVVIDTQRLSPQAREKDVPESDGLKVAYLARRVGALAEGCGLDPDSRAVSIFLVNRRRPAPDDIKDQAFAFQAELEVRTDREFLARPDLRALASNDWDDCVADVQYRDVGEYAVGHNVAAERCDHADTHPESGTCRAVRTRWIPRAEVERVEPSRMAAVELRMEVLAALTDGADANSKLGRLVADYREWIEQQPVPEAPAKRRETAQELLVRARTAATRIQRGIDLLADPQCLDAFRIANQAMADAGRKRLKPGEIPTWRPFQLAFILMNMAGIAEPGDGERDIVDLLFFPTGGGKTEAYLGLAAFTLVLRRLRNPRIESAGVTVLMRYTLRLLTLDQLGRASTLICALELLRRSDETKLGQWPFEIGLWVGRAATPNEMGKLGDNKKDTARARTIAFMNDDRKPVPVPLQKCPWCGAKFRAISFRLLPNPNEPKDLRISCANRRCEFGRGNPLPIVAVDEPIYRRLPCFVIATVDKFAALPWTGPVGGFFGRVTRYDANGFYGPCDPAGVGARLPGGRLPPPDLIIQDELHLISGPLGTMAGLYESALEELCVWEPNGHAVRPKIVASTATVRRADSQIRALFGRSTVDIFPPPGPNRRNSFFAETKSPDESNARLYVGVAAQGRSPKVAMLRVYLALLSAAAKYPSDAADPYLTLVGYFNSLRELGGSRRLIEDEVRNRLSRYAERLRVGETEGLFANRKIRYEPVELTSRVDTADVAEAKRRLELAATDTDGVDVAIATNMISVGLDITRLGLMAVFGQPKTTAEYIQATSRVGRDEPRPGLVVTILNVHKPRDRSHYERFGHYHATFYRGVEATSVTPFSPRALDKGLAGTLVGLTRQSVAELTPPRGATEILCVRARLDAFAALLGDRAYDHDVELPGTVRDRLRQRVRERATNLLNAWERQALEYSRNGVSLKYNEYEPTAGRPLLYDFLSPELKGLGDDHPRMLFRAGRSLRDVEPSVNVWVRRLDKPEVDVETEAV